MTVDYVKCMCIQMDGLYNLYTSTMDSVRHRMQKDSHKISSPLLAFN